MQRVKILGGDLTGRQWRALAAIARRLTPDSPLHLTTRQDIELHDLDDRQVPQAQAMLDEAGMTGLGACGDTLRNVTVCPRAGLKGGTVDLANLAWHVRRLMEREDFIYNLPRKFKISFSACEDACGRPWLNDLGFVARRGQNGLSGPNGWEFLVIGAGSLGPRPASGVILMEHLPSADVPAFVLAAMRVFHEHGNRSDRGRARLRHVRERLGDAEFLRLLQLTFEKARAELGPAQVDLPAAPDDLAQHRTLLFADGNLSSEAAEVIGDLADRAGVRVRIGMDHRVELFAQAQVPLDQWLAASPALSEATRPQATILVCPGKRWCNRAITRTDNMSGLLRRELGDKLPPQATVCISGCPNGCAFSQAAPIGLSGCLVTTSEGKAEAFDLYVGGQQGRGDKLAELRRRKLTADEVVKAIGELLK